MPTNPKPASAAKKAPASKPASAEKALAPMDLASAVADVTVGKPQRVYVDVSGVPRAPTADGTLATVQREQRADGTLGEYMLAEVRTNRDKTESVQRYSIARVQALTDALASKSVKVLTLAA